MFGTSSESFASIRIDLDLDDNTKHNILLKQLILQYDVHIAYFVEETNLEKP